jgi:hypothetical protein
MRGTTTIASRPCCRIEWIRCALSDPLQVVVEAGGLTPYQELEWLELRVQKLRTAGEDCFLGGVIGAAERRVSR